MTIQELMPQIIDALSKKASVQEVKIPKQVQVRKHKKKRINKKWAKKYGYKIEYETKRGKQIDVTIDKIVECCAENGWVLTDEILSMSSSTLVKID